MIVYIWLYQKAKCEKKQGKNCIKNQHSLKGLEKEMILKLQNKADAPCWHRGILVMDRRLCRSQLFADVVLLGLFPGLLLGQDWRTLSSDSPNMIFKGSPLSLQIFTSSPSHRHCHSAEAEDCLKLLGTVVTGEDHTCCSWHQKTYNFASDKDKYFHSHIVGVSVLLWEQDTSVSWEACELWTCVRNTWVWLWSSYSTMEISEAWFCGGIISLIIIIIMYFLQQPWRGKYITFGPLLITTSLGFAHLQQGTAISTAMALQAWQICWQCKSLEALKLNPGPVTAKLMMFFFHLLGPPWSL